MSILEIIDEFTTVTKTGNEPNVRIVNVHAMANEILKFRKMKNNMGMYTQEAREAAARKHGEPIEYVNELMDELGGEGEFTDPDIMVELWGEFSEYFDATWLIPSGSMMGNFAAWLVNRKVK